MSKDHVLTILLWVLLALTAGPLLWYGMRALVTERFVIKGESMEPTLHTGQGVWVNKLLMGPRIYTKFDFDSPELHCIRLPGLRKLRVGDVAIFNYPYARGGNAIAFKINYVYCKRCLGVPGDTVRLADGSPLGGGMAVVPGRGMTVVLDSVARRHYGRVIRWETGVTVGEITHTNSQNYTFRQDWYFFVGDNRAYSHDSREFGFVPADFVVGIIPGK